MISTENQFKILKYAFFSGPRKRSIRFTILGSRFLYVALLLHPCVLFWRFSSYFRASLLFLPPRPPHPFSLTYFNFHGIFYFSVSLTSKHFLMFLMFLMNVKNNFHTSVVLPSLRINYVLWNLSSCSLACFSHSCGDVSNLLKTTCNELAKNMRISLSGDCAKRLLTRRITAVQRMHSSVWFKRVTIITTKQPWLV